MVTVTARQTWIGLVILLLVVLLIVVAAVYWQHVTGVNTLHLLVDDPNRVTQGC